MEVLPQRIQDRYTIAETRNAAAMLQATNPDEFESMCRILDEFDLTLKILLTKGGNKTLVASTIDSAPASRRPLMALIGRRTPRGFR